ncbi:YkgJ family cysteine cluster protein [Pseudomonas sp. PS01298]|uniref:YkgJ family cysteine cluster protein n=1 Tax=Pseudomonas sp. PS01298 TaxID=2991434 RepID=UPI002499EAD5|nr:YkgJ family cysteine cluster protein [Pseudomonas sp. PS01298]
MDAFPCTQCGLCCQHVNMAPETQFLDRGDGTCRHYEATDKRCSIYNERPSICRVDRQYGERYAQLYSWEEFVHLNLVVCASLQANEQQLIATFPVN